jgi:hypothetical protein
MNAKRCNTLENKILYCRQGIVKYVAPSHVDETASEYNESTTSFTNLRAHGPTSFPKTLLHDYLSFSGCYAHGFLFIARGLASSTA